MAYLKVVTQDECEEPYRRLIESGPFAAAISDEKTVQSPKDSFPASHLLRILSECYAKRQPFNAPSNLRHSYSFSRHFVDQFHCEVNSRHANYVVVLIWMLKLHLQ